MKEEGTPQEAKWITYSVFKAGDCKKNIYIYTYAMIHIYATI